MGKLYYAMGGWIAFNAMLIVALLNRRSAPHARHRLARWVMGTRSQRRRLQPMRL
jgi:hypothetical protein